MQQVYDILNQFATTYGIRMLIALGILVAGWLVALFFAFLARKALGRTEIDNKIAAWLVGEEKAKDIDIERWFGRGVFYLLMIFVLVAFFQALKLTAITEPLNHFLIQIFDYAPRLIGPAILLVLAWVVATALRFVVQRVLGATQIDEKLQAQAGIEGDKPVPLSRTLGDAVYWLVFLLFLPAILGALKLDGLLSPVQGMVDKMLGFLPNLFAAALILAVGWLLARIVQRIVSNLLVAAGADTLSDQLGLAKALGEQKLSGLVGLVLYVLILVPVLVASLNALALDAITKPASEMLNTFLTALPLIFAAGLVLVIAFLVGRIVAGLAANLLAGIGFNNVLVKLGLMDTPAEDQKTPAEIAGNLVLVAIMLFATIQAVEILGFAMLAELVAQFLVFAGHVFLGLVIFAVGLYLANLAAKTVQASSTAQAGILAVAARVSIVVLAGAMALRQMGLANEIITLAFGLMLGAVAVAVALAFGLGGRDIAAGYLKDWSQKIEAE